MINIKELRIGNYVATCDPSDLYITKKPPVDEPNNYEGIYDIDIVREIYRYGAELFNDGNYSSWLYFSKFEVDKINPIPLTIEWMDAFGAKAHENTKGMFSLPFETTAENDRTLLNVWLSKETHTLLYTQQEDGEVGIIYPKHQIQYVHQLQNLYFDLTGEELMIKELVI